MNVSAFVYFFQGPRRLFALHDTVNPCLLDSLAEVDEGRETEYESREEIEHL